MKGFLVRSNAFGFTVPTGGLGRTYVPVGFQPPVIRLHGELPPRQPSVVAATTEVEHQPVPFRTAVIILNQPAPYNARILSKKEIAAMPGAGGYTGPATKIYWSTDLSVPVTSFDIQRSVDGGKTFQTIGNILADTTSATLYDRGTKRWLFTDPTGAAGNIYRIYANGPLGKSLPAIAIVPSESPAMCTVIGYITDAFGNVDTRMPIRVYNYGTRGEKWAKNPNGLLAQNPLALGIYGASKEVYADESGVWGVDLLQGSLARVHIPTLDYDHAFEVPSLPGPINVRDIPSVRIASSTEYYESNGVRMPLPDA